MYNWQRKRKKRECNNGPAKEYFLHKKETPSFERGKKNRFPTHRRKLWNVQGRAENLFVWAYKGESGTNEAVSASNI